MTWTYSVQSNQSKTVLLGAALQSSGGTNYDIGTGYSRSLASGSNSPTVNLTVPASIPAGTYSLRGAVWNDNNSSGSIDGGDTLLSGAFNYGSFTVTSPLTATLSNITTNPTSGPVGTAMTWSYTVNANQSGNVLLGAQLRSSGGTNYDIGTGYAKTLSSGTSSYSISISVPSGVPDGTYSLRGAVWRDNDSDGVINPGVDTILSGPSTYNSFTVTAALTVTLSNITTSPTSGLPGSAMTWTYSVQSNQSKTVLLGAALQSSGGTNYDIGTGYSRSLASGSNSPTVNLTVPASIPAGTYSLRGAVWNDNNSSGSIDGGDTLLSGAFNYGSFTVTSPLTATLSNITTNPTSGPVGTAMTWSYTVNANQSGNVLLGAQLRSSGGTNYDIGTGYAKTLSSGTSSYSISISVPSGVPDGTYSLRGAVWRDNDSDGVINPGVDTILSGPSTYNSFTVTAALTVTLSNITTSPTSGLPGSAMTWTYSVQSNQSKTVLLGAALQSSGGTNYDIGTGYSRSLASGSNSPTVNLTVPASIPAGTYSLRGAVWNDNNSSGSIDGGDTLLSGAFNYGSFTVTSPLTATLSNITTNPTSGPVGTAMTWSYTVNANQSGNVLLGAQLRSSGGTNYDIGTGYAKTLSSGTSSYSISISVPSGVPDGTYSLRGAVWRDNDSDGVINPGVDTILSGPSTYNSFTVTAALTVTLSNITTSPTSGLPGSAMTWTYSVQSNQSKTVLLGAALQSSGGTNYDIGTGYSRSLASGSNSPTVNLTVPASIPAGTYSLRGAVWNDNNSSGSIDGGDTLLSGAFNYGSFTVTSPLTATLSNITTNPTSGPVGTAMTWSYTVNANQSGNVLLGAQLRSSGGTNYDIGTGYAKTLSSGTSSYSISISVPSGVPDGTYSLRGAVWRDNDSDGVINPGVDTILSGPSTYNSFTVTAALTVTLSNITTSPTSGLPGSAMTWTYSVQSNQSKTVLLGAALQSSGGTNYDIGTGYSRSLASGSNSPTVNLTVPASIPAGTYSLRGAVWNDNNSSGSIDGGDTLLSGAFNYGSFTVTSPLTATLSNITTNPTSGPVGTAMTWSYTVNANQSGNVLLGAQLRSSGGTNYDIGTGYAKTLSSGTSSYSISISVPSGVPDGTYSLRGAVWRDNDSDGVINPGVDTILSGPSTYNSFTVTAALTVTLSNITTSPTSGLPGSAMTWTYSVQSNQSKTVLLGAALQSSGGTNYDIGTGYSRSLASGSNSPTVNLTVPASIPAGTYSLRGAVWNDNNSSGSIDGGDTLLSGAFNYGSFTVTSPLTATLSNITTNPTSGPVGTAMTWSYTVNANQSGNVLLGAQLRSSGGTNYDIGTGYAKTLSSGTSSYSISISVPSGVPDGTYSLRGAVWRDNDSDGVINPGVDTILSGPSTYNSFTVTAALTVTLSNITTSPTSGLPGSAMTWTYSVQSNQSKTVLLGAALQSSGGTNYDIGTGYSRSLASGSNSPTVNLTVPASIPAGTYSLRGAVWNDNNSSGSIDGGDTLLSGAFNYGSFTVTSPLTATLSNITTNPTSGPVGTAMTWSYTVNANQSGNVLLGAQLRSSGGTNYDIGTGYAKTLSSGTSSYSISISVPSGVPDGTYSLRGAVWRDNDSDGVINPGVDTILSGPSTYNSFAVTSPPVISGFSGVMRTDGRLDFKYTATNANGIGYVAVYIVNSDQSVNPAFTVASEVPYTTGLTSGLAQTAQPWTAAQISGWLTSGTFYRLRMKAQNILGSDSGWVYSATFLYTAPASPPTVQTPLVAQRSDGRLDVTTQATDSDGLGYLGIYLVDVSTAANPAFSAASKIEVTSGLTGGQSQIRQPWTATQLASWLSPGSQYRVRIKYQDTRAADSDWVYSDPFTYAGTANAAPTVAGVTATVLSGGALQVSFTATDDSTASLGIEIYLSMPGGAGDPGSYNLSSKMLTTAASGAATSYFYPAAEVTRLCTAGQPHGVRVRAFDGSGAMGQGFSAAFTAPQSATTTTDVFSFPFGTRQNYTTARDNDGWYASQTLGSPNASFGGFHLGEDWNLESGGNTDLGQPVFAIGDGTVAVAGSYTGWGNIVIIRHTLADGRQLESFYAHLDRMDVVAGQVVSRGQQIGTVGDGGGTQEASHLHLELRENTGFGWPAIGIGYSASAQPIGWLDPSVFIRAHLPNATGVQYTLYRVSDTSGQSHSSNPGQSRSLFTQGQVVRLTFMARNTGGSTPTYALCNVRNGQSETTVYRSPKNSEMGSDGAVGGGVAISGASLLGTGQSMYFSFDVATSTLGAGGYDVSGRLWGGKSGPSLDSTAEGIGDFLDDSWWKNDQFIITTGIASSAEIQGVDVSRHNGTINWTQLAAERISFAYIRSSLGTNIPDTQYVTNASGAKAAGIVHGAYHFAYPAINTALTEASYFVRTARSQIGAGFLPPALDVENQSDVALTSSLSTAALTDWILAFCREVQRQTGVKPIVYMNRNFATNEVDARVSEFPLWVADYGPNDGRFLLSRSPSAGVWSSWSLWQFTSRATLTGNGSTYIDRNYFPGDQAAFMSFIGSSTAVPPPSPVLKTPGAATPPGVSLASLTPRFTWDAASTATGYELTLINSQANLEVFKNDTIGTVTTFDLPPGILVQGQTYFWQMRARRGELWSPPSAPRYFSTGGNVSPPVKMTLVSPAGAALPGSTVTSLTPTLTWKAQSTAVQYQLQIWETASGERVFDNDRMGNISSFQVPAGTLAEGRVYLWKVTGWNAVGWGPASAPSYFTTPRSSGTTPSTPVLLGPGSTSTPYPVLTSLVPALTWQSVTAADCYAIIVNDTETGIRTYEDSNLAPTSNLTLPEGRLLPGKTYSWSLRVRTGGLWSNWATAFNFQTKIDLSAPAITSLPMTQLTGSIAAQSLTVLGTNFQKGATLLLSNSALTENPLPPSKVVVQDATKLTATLTTGTSADSWIVKVRNPDGKTSNAEAFTVVAPSAPLLVAPDIYPLGGKRDRPVLVNLTHPDSGVSIHYTLDGTAPLLSSPRFSAPILLGNANVTVRARAFKDGARPADASQIYTFALPSQALNTTVFNKSAGSEGYYFTIPVTATTNQVSIATSGGTGDCSLYIGFNRLPKVDNYDRISETIGNEESISIQHPPVGKLYVMLTGSPALSGLSISVSATSTSSKAVKPRFSYEPGLHRAPIQDLFITSDEAYSTIYYTTDPNAPDPGPHNAAALSAGQSISVLSTTRVRARSVVQGKLPSDLLNDKFIIVSTTDPELVFRSSNHTRKQEGNLAFEIDTPLGVEDQHHFHFTIPADDLFIASNRVKFAVAMKMSVDGQNNVANVYFKRNAAPTTADYDYRLSSLPDEPLGLSKLNLGKATPPNAGIKRETLVAGARYYCLLVAKGGNAMGGALQLPSYTLKLKVELLQAELLTPFGTNLQFNKPNTWLAIHGREDELSSGSSTPVHQLAEALEYLPTNLKSQVVMLDWNSMSQDSYKFLSSAVYIPAVSSKVNDIFTANGMPPDTLSVAGHSWGTFVAFKMGSTSKKLKRLIALDPASVGLGGFDDSAVKFGTIAQKSWAFVANGAYLDYGVVAEGIAGSPTKAATAKEAFVIRDRYFNQLSDLLSPVDYTISMHRAPVEFFTHTLTRNYGFGSTSDVISDYFKLDRLDAQTGMTPWQADKMGNEIGLQKFEADILADIDATTGIDTTQGMSLRFVPAVPKGQSSPQTINQQP